VSIKGGGNQPKSFADEEKKVVTKRTQLVMTPREKTVMSWKKERRG
jgi:hypothetical protein